MEQLSYKICESFGQFPEYQNLEGLTATNLAKMDEEKKTLPLEGNVGDYLRNGDIIYLDLISNEIWIKTNISISNVINKASKLNISMDVKINVESSFKELRHKLLKSAIICYLDKFSKKENNFHYIVSEFSIFTSDYGNIEENKLKTFDDMKIKQLFNFKNNMKIGIKFYPLEFVLFQKLKAIPRPKKEKPTKRKILWDRFKTLRFRELLYNIKYIKEKEYIFNYIKNLFRDKTLLSKCYVYSLNEDFNASTTEEVFDEIKNEEEKDLSNLNINEAERDSEVENTLKKNRTLGKSNNSILNRSSRSKTTINISNIFPDDIKYTLIVVPPNSNEDNEEEKDTSFIKKRFSTKEFDAPNATMNKDSDNEEDEENEIIIKKKRRDSFYEKLSMTKKKFGTLDFEIIENNNLLNKDDDEMIIYKDLKPKEIMKNPTRRSGNKWGIPNKTSLCQDFEKYFDKNKFIDFVSGLYLLNIQKGALERCTIPNFRGFKIVEKKNMLKNKKRKKKRLKYGSFYGQIFPIKRLNFEIGIFSIFVFAIFMFLSYLISNTYY